MGFVFVKCTFEQSAFSGERVFTIAVGQGSLYVGIAPLHYCYSGGRLLSPQEPGKDTQIEGELAARLIREGTPNAYVVIPDGEKVHVPAANISRRNR